MNDLQKESMRISWVSGVRQTATIRGHQLIIDQPKEDGGDDQGVTPVELFVASLGACIGYFAVRFCQRHQLSASGLAVQMVWDYDEEPHRVGALTAQVSLPIGFPSALKERLQKVVEGCTIHHSLTHPPKVDIALKQEG